MQFLRQSTASQEVTLGPIVGTDGVTPYTSALLASEIKVFKHGATALANKNSGGSTHIASGIHYCVLDATDTDTAGLLTLFVVVSGNLIAREKFQLLPGQVYDALVGNSGNGLLANAVQISGSGTAADRLELGALATVPGTVDNTAFTATATEFEASNITSAPADLYNGRFIVFTSGTYAGKASKITDYALASGRGHFTVESLGNAPGNNDTFIIL